MTKSRGKKRAIVLDDEGDESNPAPRTCLSVINIYHYVNTIVATKRPHASLANPMEI
jgi:hypothetical protein